MKYILPCVLSVCTFLTLGASCSRLGVLGTPVQVNTNVSQVNTPRANTNVSTPQTPTGQPSPVDWQNPPAQGPWNGSVNLATSADGVTFTAQSLVVSRAGVPNVTQLQDGTLVLTYQYFSNEKEELFDIIAYSVSADQGKTWTAPAALTFSGLPNALGERKPMDPALVQLSDGRLRMYFTYHVAGTTYPTLYVATTPDANITSTFVAESTAAASITEGILLDPTVIFFNEVWHHYSWQMDSDDNIHTTSSDGLTFTQQANINLPMDFLGQVIAMDNGLRFFGTGKGKIVSAFSTDGSTWTMDDGFRLDRGADPGIAQLDDGTYVMVYTSQNFNVAQ